MKLERDHAIIAVSAAIIVVVIFLFPEWIAVHPSDNQTMRLGYGWIFSHPPPPANFTGMLVERDWSSNIYFAIAALIAATILVAVGLPKAEPE
jgi:hypothetical protein